MTQPTTATAGARCLRMESEERGDGSKSVNDPHLHAYGKLSNVAWSPLREANVLQALASGR